MGAVSAEAVARLPASAPGHVVPRFVGQAAYSGDLAIGGQLLTIERFHVAEAQSKDVERVRVVFLQVPDPHAAAGTSLDTRDISHWVYEVDNHRRRKGGPTA